MPSTYLDFQQAKANHLQFKSRLRAILYEDAPADDAAVLSQYACAVGRWIYSHALIAYEAIPEIKDLERVHATIHTTARDLIGAYRLGRVLEARQGLVRMEQIADELVQLLDRVEGKVMASEAALGSLVTGESRQQSVGNLSDLLQKNQRLDEKLKVQSQELAQKEQIFSTIMAVSPVALWMSDPQGAVTYVNQTWIDWSGRPFEAHLGGGWTEAIIEEDRAQAAQRFLTDVAARRSHTMDFRIRRQDGAIRWCTVEGKPWYTQGVFSGYAGSCMDVTDRRVAEQALYEKTEQERQVLHNFFMQAPAAHCILRGSNHVFELVNPRYQELVGDRDVLGKTVRAALPELQDQGFFELLDRVFTTREAFVGREVLLSLDKGPGIRTEAYVNFIYQPIINQQDETDGILVFAYEVTEQVVARRQIEASEARFRSLIKEAPVATGLYVGRDMIIEVANQSILTAWGKDESVLGKPLAEALPELAGQPFLPLLDELFTTGRTHQERAARVELEVNGVLGSYYFDYTYKPLLDENGVVYAILNMALDVTKQVVARQELEASEARFRQLSEELDERVRRRTEELRDSNRDLLRSNQNLEKFAYIASHDLQEPLRKIQQFGDLLTNQYAAQLGEGVDYLQRMQSAANRMSMLIKDLLAFSRISTRQESIASVSLTEVVDRALDNLSVAITETNACLRVDALPTVQGDASQLGQLFQNLLSNAIKFRRTDETGVPIPPDIRVTAQDVAAAALPPSIKPARPAAAYHRIEVSDNGIGFDQKYVDRIFQVFQRLHGKNEFAGTGIGLAICEKVVMNHGGVITATSQPGAGTTFIVYLP